MKVDNVQKVGNFDYLKAELGVDVITFVNNNLLMGSMVGSKVNCSLCSSVMIKSMMKIGFININHRGVPTGEFIRAKITKGKVIDNVGKGIDYELTSIVLPPLRKD